MLFDQNTPFGLPLRKIGFVSSLMFHRPATYSLLVSRGIGENSKFGGDSLVIYDTLSHSWTGPHGIRVVTVDFRHTISTEFNYGV